MMDIKSLPKLLYVGDTDDSRTLVRQLLESRYIVLEARDPLSGIELARDTLPDMVLLDLALPQMNGREVATRLNTIIPQAPVVALIVDTAPGARAQLLAAGFAGCLPKPIEVKTFAASMDEFLHGKREELHNAEAHLRQYQSELVEHLEAKIRELTSVVNRNYHLQKQNQEMINILIRRQSMLEAGARVSHGITSILNLSDLLGTAVGIICNEFGLHYSGIFLLSEDGKSLRLVAGHGEAGAAMLRDHFQLPVDRQSMIGTAVLDKKAGISLDVEGEASHFKNPYVPETRSEMALPLIFKDRVLGSLSVQSVALNAFTEDDITSLQSLADQIAIAIHNAQLIRQLDSANQELVRSKTYEAIATATGEAIHWVGNKAAPVPGSVRRLREDLLNLVAVFQHLVAAKQAEESPFAAVAENLFGEASAAGVDLPALAESFLKMPARQLQALISLESMLEDLQIIDHSATTILSIKEDLIGPARQRKPVAFSLTDELSQLVTNMALPKGVVTTEWAANLPQVLGDPRQVDQVFNNLVKNAWEALDGRPDAHIHVSLRADGDPAYLLACVRDNGPGIPPEAREKIWVSFFTTKGGKGGTGLGLSACMEIVRQNGGKIWVESEPGKGAAFYVTLPVAS